MISLNGAIEMVPTNISVEIPKDMKFRLDQEADLQQITELEF